MLGAAPVLGLDSGIEELCLWLLDLSLTCQQPEVFAECSRSLGRGWWCSLAPALASSGALVFSLLCLGLSRSHDRVPPGDVTSLRRCLCVLPTACSCRILEHHLAMLPGTSAFWRINFHSCLKLQCWACLEELLSA